MSVIKAILFYSKYNKKSLEMKEYINKYNADIETISVDSSKIKNLLLNDDKFNINKIPSILILYSTGQFKIYINKNLDLWFNQLIENINNYKLNNVNNTELNNTELNNVNHIDNNFNDIPNYDIQDNNYTNININPVQASMINQHIKNSEPLIPINIEPPINTQKEVKKDGLSPAELAKQMAEQRDQYDEKLEENRPFF